MTLREIIRTFRQFKLPYQSTLLEPKSTSWPWRSWLESKSAMRGLSKYEVSQGTVRHDWDIQAHVWPVRCRQQSAGNDCGDKRAHLVKLKKLMCCESLIQHLFFSFGIVDSWNSLPPEVAHAPSLQYVRDRLDSTNSQDRKFFQWILPSN